MASGVEFAPYPHIPGTAVRHNVFAKREVIIAAGVIKVRQLDAHAAISSDGGYWSQTPQLLQLSGIGGPDVLDPLDIKVLNNLPAVGKNLQEQVRKKTRWITNAQLTTLSVFFPRRKALSAPPVSDST